MKKNLIKILALLGVVIIIFIYIDYSNKQEKYWLGERTKAEELLNSTIKLRSDVEYPLGEIKSYLDKVHAYKSDPGYPSIIAKTPIIPAYEQYLATSINYIGSLKKNEEIVNQMIEIIKKRDQTELDILKNKLASDVNLVSNWSDKYVEEGRAIQVLRDAMPK